MRFALIAAAAAVSAFATAAYADGMRYYLDYSDGFQRPVTLAQLPKDMAGCHAFATSSGNELHCPVSGASQQSAQEQAPPPAPRYYQPPPAQYYQSAPQNNSGQVVASFLGALAGAYIGTDRGYYGYSPGYYRGPRVVEYYDRDGFRRNWR